MLLKLLRLTPIKDDRHDSGESQEKPSLRHCRK